MKSQPPFGYVHRRLPIGESDASGNGGSTGTGGSGGGGASGGGLAFDSATYSVDEDGGSVTVVVNRVGTYNGACSVSYATSDGTATAPDDYTATSGTLTWPDGDATSREIEIPIIDDSSSGVAGNFHVTLSDPVGLVVLSIPFATLVTINSDDINRVFLTQAEFHYISGTFGSCSVVFSHSGSDAMGVFYIASGGNFPAPIEGEVTWDEGDLDDKTVNFDIGTFDPPATASIDLSGPVNAVLGTYPSAFLVPDP